MNLGWLIANLSAALAAREAAFAAAVAAKDPAALAIVRQRKARERVLHFLESHPGWYSIWSIANGIGLGRERVDGVVQALLRESLVQSRPWIARGTVYRLNPHARH